MKFTITKENLKLAIGKVSNAISGSITLPALLNILVEADGDTVCFTASDLEISIRATVSALVFEAGATTIPARKLSQIASDLPADEATIETGEDDVAVIKSRRSVFRIHGISASMYQRPDEIEPEWSFTMPSERLMKDIAKVAYARSTEENRRVLNGVLFSVRSGSLTIAATDGRRLALVERPLENDIPSDGDIILPTKVTGELKQLDQGDVTVQISPSSVTFRTKDTEITSKLIDGIYPNYRQVIPSSFGHSVSIPRSVLMDAIRRVSIVVQQDQSSSIKVTFSENLLMFSAESPEVGEASESVDLPYAGKPLTIALDPRFFAEPLKLLSCEEVTMKFSDDLSPVQLSGDTGFLYIIMPLRK